MALIPPDWYGCLPLPFLHQGPHCLRWSNARRGGRWGQVGGRRAAPASPTRCHPLVQDVVERGGHWSCLRGRVGPSPGLFRAAQRQGGGGVGGTKWGGRWLKAARPVVRVRVPLPVAVPVVTPPCPIRRTPVVRVPPRRPHPHPPQRRGDHAFRWSPGKRERGWVPFPRSPPAGAVSPPPPPPLPRPQPWLAGG